MKEHKECNDDRTLCNRCASDYIGTGIILKQINNKRTRCDKCDRWGFTYRIMKVFDYQNKRWELKRLHILKRDGYLCQLSKRYGKRVDAKVVHHIYPVDEYPEYAWGDWNLISISGDMHNKLHDRVTGKLTTLGQQLKRKTIPPPPNEKI